MTPTPHESPPLPWSTNQLAIVCPAVVGSTPLAVIIDDRGKVLKLGAVPARDDLGPMVYSLLTDLGPEGLNRAHAVVFMADAARNVADLPVEPRPGDVVMLARDGDSRAVDTVAVTFVTIVQTRQVCIDYKLHDGTPTFAEPIELTPHDSHITPSVLKAWSQAIETVIS